MADVRPGQSAVAVRVADERDVLALARLRRSWLEERTGSPVDDPGFEAAFAQWWRFELPRRTFWVAEAGSDRAGWTAVGSLNVVEMTQMPRPGGRGGKIGYVGTAFVLASFADKGVPGSLLAAAVEHAGRRRYRRLLLAPTPDSMAFYQRAGFTPTGDTLLAYDGSASS